MRCRIESPYRPPQYDGVPIVRKQNVDEYSTAQTTKIILKWTLICAVSAAPSFVLGLILNGANAAAIAGMVLGIVVFVVAYTAVEHVPFVRQRLKLLVYRRTAWIGYGTRIAMSIIFPVGFYVDMFVGVLSVGISNWLFKVTNFQQVDISSGPAGTFVSHFVMTLIQGACLNLLLFGYLGLVFAIVYMATPGETEPVWETPVVDAELSDQPNEGLGHFRQK